jgi:hypothetical protein
MNEINQMVEACKLSRLVKVEELLDQMKKLATEPEQEFTGKYKNCIEELSAKDGLGKIYG